MSIRVLFFASLAEAAGTAAAEIESSSGCDVASVYARLARDFPRLETHRTTVLCAINSALARLDSPVRDGDELAFFPPVSGG